MDINEIVRQAVEQVLVQMNTNAAPVSAPAVQSSDLSPAGMAKYIDHTILKADTPQSKIKQICDEARQYHFASVCVNTANIKYVAEQLAGSGVTPCCVVGFPLGAMTTESKVFETMDAIKKGAKEIDMVINIGAIKSGDWNLVEEDIRAVCKAAQGNALVKVIIETCLLTQGEKVKACQASKNAGAAFVKTSTGFSTGGATVEDVKLMRETVGPNMGVKASGGVRNYTDAVNMIKAGANRLGTSNGTSIVKGDQGGHTCINCGRCKQQCPTGNTNIVNNNY